MRSVIESEMPLIVAIQHSKSGMFSKFHFTCFEWIIHGKLFHSPAFNLKNLCAAGTEEGPILLISKLTQSIVPVCLLCVHKRKVSDIVMSHQINTFLSVSIDGSIAGWHCSDGSCCFAYNNLLPQGEIKIVLCDSNASIAWFWTRGEGASLVDLKRGTVSQKIDFVGISSFAILKKQSNFITNQSSPSKSNHVTQPSFALMAGINSVRTYEIDEKTNFLKCKKVEEILFALGQKYYITSNGIVITKDRFLKIFLPNLDVPIYTENIQEMSDDDSISTVVWNNPDSLIISSFNGFFKIYKVQIHKNDNAQRISIQKVTTFSCQNCCIFSNVALNFDIGFVIFSATSFPKKSKKSKKFSSANQSTVMCLSINDQKVVKLVIPQIDKICCIPDPKSRIVIQADQHSTTFQIFDWGSSTSIIQSNNSDENNISMNSSEYKSNISRSFFGRPSINVNNALQSIPSNSDVRNYSLFGKQFPMSQSVDFRPNVSTSFFMREGSITNPITQTYITAIACQNFNNLSSRLQIIVGTSDGKLYFFWENSFLPFDVFDALISPVISIVLLPIRFTKASCLIAIGKDGSFCLFKWNKMSHRYATNFLPIVAIGVIETQRLIVVQKSDNSFSVYNLNSPEPISVMPIPPPRTVFIWSKVNYSKPAGIQSTLSIEISGSSLFYSVLEVSKLKKYKAQKIVNNKIVLPKNVVGGTIQKSVQNTIFNPKKEKKITEPNSTPNIADNSNSFAKDLIGSKSAENSRLINSKIKTNACSDTSMSSNTSSKSVINSNIVVNLSQNSNNLSSSKTETIQNSKTAINSNDLDDKKNSITDKKNGSISKSNSNSNFYSEYSELVRKVNTDSNSDSMQNSDSTNDFTSTGLIFSNQLNSITNEQENDIDANEVNDKEKDTNDEKNLNDKEKDTNDNEKDINDKENDLNDNEKDINDKENDLNDNEKDINDKENDLNDKENDINDNEKDTNDKENDLNNKENDLNNKENDLNDKENDLNDKENDLNDLLPINESPVSENFDDSLVKLSLRSILVESHSASNADAQNKSDSNPTKNATKNDTNSRPISWTGRFRTADIKRIVTVILEMMVPTTTNIENSNSMKNFPIGSIESSKRFNSIDYHQDGLSFALVGHKNLPTFFYPMFKLMGPTVFDTSPFNAALHYLSYKIMSNFLNLIRNTEKFEKENKFKICGFISILTQLLFINDPEIQRISALTCNRIVNWSSSGIVVPEHVWNLLVASYIQYFDKNDLADYDKFLMAIMMVTHSDLIDPIYHNIVFDFLKKTAQERSPSNFLAFNILTGNFDFWAEFLGDENKNKNKNKNSEETANSDTINNTNSNVNKKGKKELLSFLISSFFKYEIEEKKLVKEKLCNIIKENFDSFCETIRFLLSSNTNQNFAQATCDICFDLAEQHPRSIGSLGPLLIAYLADVFIQFHDIFYSSLKLMQTKFKGEIVNQDQIWIIATNDGLVHVFKNMKFFFKEKISDGPILLVSIGPSAAFAAAITENDPTLVKIDLKSSFFLSLNKKRVVEKNKIEFKNGIPFNNRRIVWDNKESCHVEYY